MLMNYIAFVWTSMIEILHPPLLGIQAGQQNGPTNPHEYGQQGTKNKIQPVLYSHSHTHTQPTNQPTL